MSSVPPDVLHSRATPEFDYVNAKRTQYGCFTYVEHREEVRRISVGSWGEIPLLFACSLTADVENQSDSASVRALALMGFDDKTLSRRNAPGGIDLASQLLDWQGRSAHRVLRGLPPVHEVARLLHAVVPQVRVPVNVPQPLELDREPQALRQTQLERLRTCLLDAGSAATKAGVALEGPLLFAVYYRPILADIPLSAF